GGRLHVDAVQAAGRIPCDINVLEADLLTLSGHKIGGPKGAGALVKRAPLNLDALVTGGGQERRRRAGTENVAAIAGFGAAAGAAQRDLALMERVHALRDALEIRIRAISPSAGIMGAETAPPPKTTRPSRSRAAAPTPLS